MLTSLPAEMQHSIKSKWFQKIFGDGKFFVYSLEFLENFEEFKDTDNAIRLIYNEIISKMDVAKQIQTVVNILQV